MYKLKSIRNNSITPGTDNNLNNPQNCWEGAEWKFLFPWSIIVRVGSQTGKDLWASSITALVRHVIYVSLATSGAEKLPGWQNGWEMVLLSALNMFSKNRPTKDSVWVVVSTWQPVK